MSLTNNPDYFWGFWLWLRVVSSNHLASEFVTTCYAGIFLLFSDMSVTWAMASRLVFVCTHQKKTFYAVNFKKRGERTEYLLKWIFLPEYVYFSVTSTCLLNLGVITCASVCLFDVMISNHAWRWLLLIFKFTRGTQQSFALGGSSSRSSPLFLTEKVPLSYTSITHTYLVQKVWIPFICCKCTVFKTPWSE